MDLRGCAATVPSTPVTGRERNQNRKGEPTLSPAPRIGADPPVPLPIRWGSLTWPRVEEFEVAAGDTVIEVIDPVTNEVLASRRVDEFYWSGLGDGHYTSYKENTDGTPQIHVWRVQLTRAGR